MAELDTAAERAELADPAIDADSMLYVLGKCTSYLDAYDRLRAENQRLREERDDLHGAMQIASGGIARPVQIDEGDLEETGT